MIIAAVAAFCALLLVLAFVAPRLSHKPEQGGKSALGKPASFFSKAPGKLGEWMSKPFHKGQKAIGKSGRAGRKARGKAPV